MKLLETKNVKIGDKEYPVKLCVRSMMNYETISEKTIAHATDTIKDRTIIFHQCLVACGYTGSYDDFLQLIDDKPAVIGEFISLVFVEVEKKPKAR